MKPKSLFLLALTLVLTAGAILGIKYSLDAHAAAVALQAKQQNQKWIAQLEALNTCGQLTTEEQTRLDNAGDDPFKVQTAYIQIHQNRLNFWDGQINDVIDRSTKLDNLVATNPYLDAAQVQEARVKIKDDAVRAMNEHNGFKAALKALKDWRPLSDSEQAAADKKKALDAKETDPKA